MAITKVQDVTRTGFQANTTATTGTLGATPSNNNLLYCVMALADDGSGRSYTPPSGWTAVPNAVIAYSTSWSIGIWYKVAGGSESTSYTWSWSGGNSTNHAFYLAEYTGVDTSTPIDTQASSWDDGGLGTSDLVASAITVTANALDIVIGNNQFQSGYSMADGTYTEQVDQLAMGVYTKTITSAGSTGTRAVSRSVFQNGQSFSFALKAGAAPDPPGDPHYNFLRKEIRPSIFKPGLGR